MPIPFTRFWALCEDRSAVTAMEYALIAAAVVVVGLAGFSIVGTDVAAKYAIIANATT